MQRNSDRARGRSVGRALQVREGIANDDLREVVAAIDRVHGDGMLPSIPLAFVDGPSVRPVHAVDGAFVSNVVGRDEVHAQAIFIRRRAPNRRFVALHEIGHFLDACGLPGKGWSSESHPMLVPWRQAVIASRAYRGLIELSEANDSTTSQRATVLLDTTELWARSYAQFVAARSGVDALKNSIDVLRQREPGEVYWPRQWDDEDFGEIEVAIEGLFRRVGWMK
jgi:hypothetical protein